MSSIFRTNRLKYSNTFAGHGEHSCGDIVVFSWEHPYWALQHNEHRTNSIAIHADKVSINKKLVWETFMAQNRGLMMATNKFLVTV